jgi:large subunit ribosomal protein L3
LAVSADYDAIHGEVANVKKGIIGKKLGMTQIFDETGLSVPVTVVEAGPCVVIQKRTKETDGYEALQVGFGSIKEKHLNKPKKGHFAKGNVEPKKYVRELKLENSTDYNVGDVITVELFENGDLVDVTGTSRGKGFAGPIKRWGFGRGLMTHGSKYHRRTGSLSSGREPSHVFKGRKMPGQMGNVRRTVQNLKVFRIDPERNLILIRGSVPGSKGGLLLIRSSVKA